MIGYAMPIGSSLVDLPLVELPAAHQPRTLAVILSGDGGWRDIDRQIGEVLASGDIGVVGLDTLRYFWTARTPEQVGRDLDRIVTSYQKKWKVHDVVLVGYSLGASVLPAAYNRMSEGTRRAVVQLTLLGLARAVAFEFHLGGWLGLASSDAQPVVPDAARLDMAKVQCVYGEEEEDTLCRDPLFANAELIKTAGGHHFDGDYKTLARRIIDGLERRQVRA